MVQYGSQATDKGHCNNSASTTCTDSSLTHAKTAYAPKIQAPVTTIESTVLNSMIFSTPQLVNTVFYFTMHI